MEDRELPRLYHHDPGLSIGHVSRGVDDARSRVTAQQLRLTFEEKQQRLIAFEFMHRDQVPYFRELFERQEYDIDSVDYQAWLLYKKQALGTEAEAIQRVIASHIPKNIVRSTRKQANNFPGGADRHGRIFCCSQCTFFDP